MRRQTVALFAAAALAAGCGYTLVGRASNIPPEVKIVYLAPFGNATQRVNVDQIVTRALNDELVTRQRFTVVSTPESGDADLVGNVTGFEVRPVTFDSDRRATEYEISITASDTPWSSLPSTTATRSPGVIRTRSKWMASSVCSTARTRYPACCRPFTAAKALGSWCQGTEDVAPRAVFSISRCGGQGVNPQSTMRSTPKASAVRNMAPTL